MCRKLKRSRVWLGLIALWFHGHCAQAGDIEISSRFSIGFADENEARKILGTNDEFVRALSPFDRAARMKTDQTVSEAEYLAFVERSVRAWSPEETSRFRRRIEGLAPKLAPLNLPLPETVWLIKTSGTEEGNEAYTRQNAIIIPEYYMKGREDALDELLLHELFHVLSRSQSGLREKLYRVIGFSRVNEVVYPAELQPRKITNPDGVHTGWTITVTNRGESMPVIPILFASPGHYDATKGGEFTQYLQFRLMAVEQVEDNWRARLQDGHPRLLEPAQVTGFFEQVGKNTGYIIHPDEILADNFVHMIKQSRNLPSPRVVGEMKQILTSTAGKQ